MGTNVRPRGVPVWVWIVGGVLLFLTVAPMMSTFNRPSLSKMEMAQGIHVGQTKASLLQKFGEPDSRDRAPGPLPNETWTYRASDGTVFVSVHAGGFVTDVWTY